MGDVPGIYATRKPRKSLQTLGHGDLPAAGRYAASLCRDLGGDPTMAEAALADLAGLWIVLARQAIRDDSLHNAALATSQARSLLMAVGLRRSARDVSPSTAPDSDRPLRSTALVVPVRVGRAQPLRGDAALVPPGAPAAPAVGGSSAGADARPVDGALTPAAADEPPAASAPAASPPPTPPSATPPAHGDEGPSAQENRSGFPESGGNEVDAGPGDLVGTHGCVLWRVPLDGEGPMDDIEEVAAEALCPECGQVLTPAGEGLPPLVCEACGWPPVLEAANEGGGDGAGDSGIPGM